MEAMLRRPRLIWSGPAKPGQINVLLRRKVDAFLDQQMLLANTFGADATLGINDTLPWHRCGLILGNVVQGEAHGLCITAATNDLGHITIGTYPTGWNQTHDLINALLQYFGHVLLHMLVHLIHPGGGVAMPLQVQVLYLRSTKERRVR